VKNNCPTSQCTGAALRPGDLCRWADSRQPATVCWLARVSKRAMAGGRTFKI